MNNDTEHLSVLHTPTCIQNRHKAQIKMFLIYQKAERVIDALPTSMFHHLKKEQNDFHAGAKHKSASPCCFPTQLLSVPLWIQSRPGTWFY